MKSQNQYIIWEVIHDWVNVYKKNRLKHFETLIKESIQLDLLTKKFIREIIFESTIFQLQNTAFQKELKLFVKRINFKQNQKMYSTSSERSERTILPSRSRTIFRQLSQESTNQLLVCIDCYKESAVEFFDHQLNSWRPSPFLFSFPNKISFNLEMLDDDGHMLYAFGGKDKNGTATKKGWSLDLSEPNSQWTAMAPMRQRRKDFASVVFNDVIYALGGQLDDELHIRVLNTCERYDSHRNVWTSIAPMAIARHGASAAVYAGFIYISGGTNCRGQIERSMERYDPGSNRWTEIAPMNSPRSSFALTTFVDRLWAIGGFDGSQPVSNVEFYDARSECWKEQLPLNGKRYNHAAVTFNDELYVVGGYKTFLKNGKNFRNI